MELAVPSISKKQICTVIQYDNNFENYTLGYVLKLSNDNIFVSRLVIPF